MFAARINKGPSVSLELFQLANQFVILYKFV